jgi:hypothetical protein
MKSSGESTLFEILWTAQDNQSGVPHGTVETAFYFYLG